MNAIRALVLNWTIEDSDEVGWETSHWQDEREAFKRLFFTVVKTGNGFVMASASATRPPGCPGEGRPKRLN